MNARQISCFGVAVGAWFASAALASDSAVKTEPAVSLLSTESPANKSATPVLEKGMTAEQIERIAGKPAEIRPLKAPEGKAESWIYRRVVDRQTRQIAATVRDVSTFNGEAVGLGSAPELEFRLEHTTVYQVTALLMFDGKLVLAKQWREKDVRYDN